MRAGGGPHKVRDQGRARLRQSSIGLLRSGSGVLLWGATFTRVGMGRIWAPNVPRLVHWAGSGPLTRCLRPGGCHVSRIGPLPTPGRGPNLDTWAIPGTVVAQAPAAAHPGVRPTPRPCHDRSLRAVAPWPGRLVTPAEMNPRCSTNSPNRLIPISSRHVSQRDVETALVGRADAAMASQELRERPRPFAELSSSSGPVLGADQVLDISTLDIAAAAAGLSARPALVHSVTGLAAMNSNQSLRGPAPRTAPIPSSTGGDEREGKPGSARRS